MSTPLSLVCAHPSLSSVPPRLLSVVCIYRDVVAAGAAYAGRADETSEETVTEATKSATSRPTTTVSTDFLMQPTSQAITCDSFPTNSRRSGLGRAPGFR